MKVAIMQPYFFPYIGYFQLINAVDKFVIYDNIKYTKKGWINRNRFLQNGTDAVFSLPLHKGSDRLDIVERTISSDFNPKKLLNIFEGSYKKAPYFNDVIRFIESVLIFPEQNLFSYLHNALIETCNYLAIDTEILVSSDLNVDSQLVSSERVLAMCQLCGAKNYINPIGGVELYDKRKFADNGLELNFLQTNNIFYRQFHDQYVPSLSIIDVMMFNSVGTVKKLLGEFQLK